MERLRNELTKHIESELLDFLGYEINSNDTSGIQNNIVKAIDDEISTYIERNELK